MDIKELKKLSGIPLEENTARIVKDLENLISEIKDLEKEDWEQMSSFIYDDKRYSSMMKKAVKDLGYLIKMAKTG